MKIFFKKDRTEAALDAAGLTRAAVAEELGVAGATVGRWVSGQSGTKREQAVEFAELLGVKLEDIADPLGGVLDEARQMGASFTSAGCPDDHDIPTPGFPPVPQVPDLDGVLDGEHLAVLEQLKDAESLAKSYLRTITDRRKEIEDALELGEEEGRIDERAVRVIVDVRPGRPHSLSYGRLDGFLATYETRCPSCDAVHKLAEDLDELRAAVKAAVGKKEAVNRIVKFEPMAGIPGDGIAFADGDGVSLD